MSDSTPDVKSINPSQLKSIIQDLKKSTDDDHVVTIFQTLGKFCTSSDASASQILEDGELSKFVSDTIQNHKNKAVKIHASAFLVTLSFSVGEFKQGFAADTALSMLINIFQEIGCPENLDVLEAIELQLKHAPFSSRTLDSSVSIIEKLSLILSLDKVPENTKKNIVEMLMEILDGDFFTPVLNIETSSSSNPSTTPSPSSSKSSSFSSSSCSSSSSSSSSDYPHAFLLALANLYAVLIALAGKTRGKLSSFCLGLSAKMKERFGEKVNDKVRIEDEERKRKDREKREQEGEGEFQVSFDPDSSGVVTLSKNRCVFSSSSYWHTAFVNYPMLKGIYKIVIAVIKNQNMMLGVCLQSVKTALVNTYFSSSSSCKSSGLQIATNTMYIYPNGTSSNLYSSDPWKEGSVITMELDTSLHTVHFFVDGKVFPQYLSNVSSEALVFAVTSYLPSEIEVTSLEKLVQASVRPTSGLTPVAWPA